MSDPLSLLRHYSMEQKTIEEKDGNIIFGEFSWPKTVETNFRIQGWEKKDRSQWEYYTLECLLYFLKNIYLTYDAYVKEAVRDQIPAVLRPDSKLLTVYFKGLDLQIPVSIDNSAKMEIPTFIRKSFDGATAKKAALDIEHGAGASGWRIEDGVGALVLDVLGGAWRASARIFLT